MKLRTVILPLHRWIGVVLGLVLFVIALTGSTLVFDQEIEQAIHPQLMQVVPQGERLKPEVVLNTVRSAFPNMSLLSIVLPRTPKGVYRVGLKSQREESIDVFINPYTGVILGTQQWGHTLMSFIYSIHNSLLLGEEAGLRVVGVCGLLFLVLVISGLVVWPGWRKLSLGLLIRWKAPAQMLAYDFHKVIGVLSAAFLLLTAATGAAMIFNSEFENATYWLTNTSKPTPPVSEVVASQPEPQLTEILHKASAALPLAQLTYVRLPLEANGVFAVYLKLPQDIDFYGHSTVYIDRYSGSILRVDNALSVPLAAQINNALLSLHNGTYGGLGMRCLYVFIGFVPPALLISGIFMWYNRNRAKYYKNTR